MARMITAALTVVASMMMTLSAAAQAPQAEAGPHVRYGRSESKPKAPGTIRIATYNVLNLFDQEDDPAISGEIDDLAMATSHERCRGLAAAIRGTDADIIALQEVESLDCLKWFREHYLRKDGYDYIASRDVGDARGIECSVLSRFPITDVKIWPSLPLDDVVREGPGWSEVPDDDRDGMILKRSPLRVEIEVNDTYGLTLFVLHHKAGRNYRHRREAEALKIVSLIDEVREKDPGRNIMVLGDFNAAPWDKSFRVYLEHGMIDTLAHRIIPRWRNAPPDEQDLFKTHESGRVLDYILVNSAAHRELVIGSPQVMGTLYDPEYDWKTDPFPEGYAADHYPVMIDLTPREQR